MIAVDELYVWRTANAIHLLGSYSVLRCFGASANLVKPLAHDSKTSKSRIELLLQSLPLPHLGLRAIHGFKKTR